MKANDIENFPYFDQLRSSVNIHMLAEMYGSKSKPFWCYRKMTMKYQKFDLKNEGQGHEQFGSTSMAHLIAKKWSFLVSSFGTVA